MEFKLNDYHRNISDDELISDVVRIATMLEKNTITIEEYDKYGNYNHTTYNRRFGSWKMVLKTAGLEYCKRNFHITNEEYVEDLQRVSKLLMADSFSATEYSKYGNYDKGKLSKRFNGWNNALLAAGLVSTDFKKSIDDTELLNDIERAWIKLGRQPTSTDIKNGASKYSLNSYSRHFGSWRKALEAFVEYINDDTVETTENTDNETEEKIIVTKAIPKTVDTHKTKRDINLRLRFKVMQRDNFKCCMCGASPATDPSVILHIDHIKPWSKGGETVIENLQTLCSKCNLGKSDLEL